jgi:hypothetical protein
MTDYYNCYKINLLSLPIEESLVHFVPYLFDIEDINEEEVSIHTQEGVFIFPSVINPSFESI